MDRIVFVAVIHTDKESVEKVKRTVSEIKPNVVAVELDHQRYEQLKSPQNENPEDGGLDTVGELMQQLALFEKALGNLHGSEIGSEMLAAIEEGKKIGAKIALVDRPITSTIQAMGKIPLDEIYKFSSMVMGTSDKIEEENFDILGFLKEDGTIDEILAEFKKEFPALYDVLIDQRDEYVANALNFILGDVDGKVVAVLGAGHIEGVKKALQRKFES